MNTSEDRQPKGARPSVFLERQSYRRRRLSDAARLLPFLGAGLMAVPLLWPDSGRAGEGVALSSAVLYMFCCWGGLIVVSLIFGFAAKRMETRDDTLRDGDTWPR